MLAEVMGRNEGVRQALEPFPAQEDGVQLLTLRSCCCVHQPCPWAVPSIPLPTPLKSCSSQGAVLSLQEIPACSTCVKTAQHTAIPSAANNERIFFFLLYPGYTPRISPFSLVIIFPYGVEYSIKLPLKLAITFRWKWKHFYLGTRICQQALMFRENRNGSTCLVWINLGWHSSCFNSSKAGGGWQNSASNCLGWLSAFGVLEGHSKNINSSFGMYSN